MKAIKIHKTCCRGRKYAWQVQEKLLFNCIVPLRDTEIIMPNFDGVVRTLEGLLALMQGYATNQPD